MKLPTPCFVRVLRVLTEIRDGIAELAGYRQSQAIHEVIDIDFIKRQTEQGAYEWISCQRLIGAVVNIIQQVQSPGRDASTLERWNIVRSSMMGPDIEWPTVLCNAFEFLLDRVNVLRIDAANARCAYHQVNI
jgi:hypothetical protein